MARFHRRIAVRVPAGGLRDRYASTGGLADRSGLIPFRQEGDADQADDLLAQPGAMLIVDLAAPVAGTESVLLLDGFNVAVAVPADQVPALLPHARQLTLIGVIVAIHDRPISAGYGAFIGDPDDPLSDETSPEYRAKVTEIEERNPPLPGWQTIPAHALLHVPTLVLETPLHGEGLHGPGSN